MNPNFFPPEFTRYDDDDDGSGYYPENRVLDFGSAMV